MARAVGKVTGVQHGTGVQQGAGVQYGTVVYKVKREEEEEGKKSDS